MRSLWILGLLALSFVGFAPEISLAQSTEEETVVESANVLREVMAIPAKGIPESMVSGAYGIAIVPGLVKGGFIIGVKHGTGIVVTKDANGAWRNPVFISITGGSIGWQAGVQSSDVVLVFRTRNSVEGMMRGKFTIGADASVAAGPVGREASAATDAQLKAEILSYSRSRGLFAGLSIDGSAIQIENRASASYYAPKPGTTEQQVPASATKLLELIVAYSTPGAARPAPVAAPTGQPETREGVRQQLVVASQRLDTVLDKQWKDYLSLPPSIVANTPNQSPEAEKQSLSQCLSKFGTVANDPRFRTLTDHREFQETYGLLNRYSSLSASNTLTLPPPPPFK